MSALVFAGMLFLAGQAHIVPGLPFSDCFMFGSLMAAVDPVATLGIFKVGPASLQRVPVSNTLHMLVLGESLLNDAVSIALFRAAASATFEPVLYFFMLFFGSVLLGIAMGVFSALLFKLVSGL